MRLHRRWLPAAREASDPVVVMLHGLITGSHASWWMTCAPRLARSHRVLTYDLRGHGYSDRPLAGYGIVDHLEDLVELLDSEQVDRAALVGHSFGARLALEAARRIPDRVVAVAAVEAPLCDPIGGMAAWRASVPTEDKARDRGPRRGTTPKRTRHAILPAWRETSLAEDLDEPWPSLAELASLRCPVRCYFGDRSPFRTSADVARAAFGSSSVRVLEGGHGLHVDAKVALGNELERFLSSEGAESASRLSGFDLAIGASHG